MTAVDAARVDADLVRQIDQRVADGGVSEDHGPSEVVRRLDELAADPEHVFARLARQRYPRTDPGVHEEMVVDLVMGHGSFEEAEVAALEAGGDVVGIGPGRLEAEALERVPAPVAQPGVAVGATAAEPGEHHVFVVAAQEDRLQTGQRGDFQEEIDDAARVGATVDVVAEAGERVARREVEALEQGIELAQTSVDVADDEGPPSHHRPPVRSARRVASSMMRSAPVYGSTVPEATSPSGPASAGTPRESGRLAGRARCYVIVDGS